MRPAEITVDRRESLLRELSTLDLVERDERDGERWRLTLKGRRALGELMALGILAAADAYDAAEPDPSFRLQ